MRKSCSLHPEVMLEWEPGGDDMPTLRGRWRCSECDAAFARLVDGPDCRDVL